jgi:phosphatidate phosphatase PAH1
VPKKAKTVGKTQKQINDEKIVEFAAKIEKYEREQTLKAKIFDPYELMSRTDGIKTVDHPVLGKLKFGELTFEDAFEIDKCKSNVEKTETVAWLMMRKAYPDLPRDFLKRMPLIEGAALIDFLTKQPAFLSHQKSSANGSKLTRKRKTSA